MSSAKAGAGHKAKTQSKRAARTAVNAASRQRPLSAVLGGAIRRMNGEGMAGILSREGARPDVGAGQV